MEEENKNKGPKVADNNALTYLTIRPVTLRVAQEFIRQHHRHNRPPVGHKFSIGLYDGEHCIGVATAGRPVARLLDDGLTLEVTRTCTDGTRNANSILYGAIARAAKALGYLRCITYTQCGETGASLRGAGWECMQDLPARSGWGSPSRPREDIGSGGIARKRWEIEFIARRLTSQTSAEYIEIARARIDQVVAQGHGKDDQQCSLF